MKIYTLWTFGSGTVHITADRRLALRWAQSNYFRGYTEWDTGVEQEQIEHEIETEEAKKRPADARVEERP